LCIRDFLSKIKTRRFFAIFHLFSVAQLRLYAFKKAKNDKKYAFFCHRQKILNTL